MKKAILHKVPLFADSSIAVQEWRSPFFSVPWHFHPEYELVLILESQGKRFIGDSIVDFYPGDLVLIGSNLPHWYRNDPAYYEKDAELEAASVLVQFPYNFLGDTFLSTPEALAIRHVLQEAQLGLQICGATKEKITEMMKEIKHLHGMDRILHFLSILNTLCRSKEYFTLATPGTSAINSKDSARINRIFEYVLKNYEKQISVEEMANLVHMCPATFCRFFKKRTRKTFTHFLNEIRIGHACKMLVESDLSITEICFTSGYNNVSHFNRQFKILKRMTPQAFKQQYYK